MTPDIPTLQAEIAYYREALRGLRGLAVLEAIDSPAWRKAVQQIDEVLEGPLPEIEPAERDDMPSLQQEREMRDAKLDCNHRGAVPRTW